VGISSLDILAKNVKSPCDFIIPVIDAKRGLVYSAIFKFHGGRIKRVCPYMLLNPLDLVKNMRKKVPAKALLNSVILGDGLNIFPEECRASLKGSKFLDKDYWGLEGESMIELAELAIRGKRSSDAFGLKPLYLYPKECQIRHHHLNSR
jgi:tRNA threonylcarbamoyladenosine biosynthesis protein TsaB